MEIRDVVQERLAPNLRSLFCNCIGDQRVNGNTILLRLVTEQHVLTLGYADRYRLRCIAAPLLHLHHLLHHITHHHKTQEEKTSTPTTGKAY